MAPLPITPLTVTLHPPIHSPLPLPPSHRHRLLRIELGAKKTRTRKQWKDLKKKKRTTWGTGKRAAQRAARKAAAS